MKRIIILTLCCLYFQFDALGEVYTIPNPDSVPFFNIEHEADLVKKAVFAVQINIGAEGTNQRWEPLGSGFFLMVAPNEHVTFDPNILLGVTCAHVVKAAEEVNRPIFICHSTDKGYRRIKCEVLSKDTDTDVAILGFLKDPNEETTISETPFRTKTFGDANSLVEGRSVIVAGFPLGLGVEVDKEYPVIRTGIVAQYTGRKIFLVDGIASHGNSGSPVVAVKFGQNQLLGMITSFQPDGIELFDENHNRVAWIPYNSGLSQAVTADEIHKCIEKIRQ